MIKTGIKNLSPASARNLGDTLSRYSSNQALSNQGSQKSLAKINSYSSLGYSPFGGKESDLNLINESFGNSKQESNWLELPKDNDPYNLRMNTKRAPSSL